MKHSHIALAKNSYVLQVFISSRICTKVSNKHFGVYAQFFSQKYKSKLISPLLCE